MIRCHVIFQHNITYTFINMTTERIMSLLTKKWKSNAY